MVEMKKVVVKLDVHDDRSKQKAMKIVSGLTGVDSIGMDMKEKKLTVMGEMDPVTIVKKLRKVCHADIVSVGPAKEDDKKKAEEEKKKKKEAEEKKKAEELAKLRINHPSYPYPSYPYYANANAPYMPTYNQPRSINEDPNACLIS